MKSEILRSIWRSEAQPLYFVGETAETRQQLINDVTKKVMSLIRVPQDGKTPTRKELKALISELIPTEKDFLSMIKPLIPKVKNGVDGKTPSNQELVELIKPLIPKVRNGVDGKTPSKLDILDIIRPVIIELMPKETPQLTYDQIKAVADPIIREMIREGRKGWFGGGGGGDNVRAGNGIQITTNNVGAKVISVTNPGALSILAATGTVDDSNTSFTFASTPTLVVVNGQTLRDGHGVTITGTSVTLDNPAGTGGDIYALGT